MAVHRSFRPRHTTAALERLEDRTLLTAILVDTLSDLVQSDDHVSLREAIQAANTNLSVHDAPAGQSDVTDTITFHPALTASGARSIVVGSPLEIQDDLVILGPGDVFSSALIVRGQDASQIFRIVAGVTAHLDGLFIGEGNGNQGGGIYNAGVLTVTGCRIEDSLAFQGGGIFNDETGTLHIADSHITRNKANSAGGIYNAGTLTLSTSIVSNNEATSLEPIEDFGGGGILNAGVLAILHSTVANNISRQDGGGVTNLNSATATIINSTISQNEADHFGGGIYNAATEAQPSLVLRNATIFGNIAEADGDGTGFAGGGIAAADGAVTLHNSLVAGNVNAIGVFPFDDEVLGELDAGSSHNLVADGFTAGGLIDGVNGNIVGADWTEVIDPSLSFNGGPTLTHELLPGSVAINAGGNAQATDADGRSLRTDQRGFARILGDRTDIGAFEFGGQTPAEDLVAFHRGAWYVGASNGDAFLTARFARWADVAWRDLRHADFNGDHRMDVLGRIGGNWFVGLSTGDGYATSHWAHWAALPWKDVTVADLDGDGRADILARHRGQWWAALSTGREFTAPALWGTWANVAWRYASLVDLNADGRADLLAYLNGAWWAALSTGTAFGTASKWATWANVAWDAVGTFDADGDEDIDLFARRGGSWYVARSNGVAFTTSLRSRWANVAWTDSVAGDFNGDGRDDLASRVGGRWWVSLSHAAGGDAATVRWAAWANVAWQDIRVGDFDGNGRDDVAARFNGIWYVGRSNGTGFSTSRWVTWADVDWRAVAGVDATGGFHRPGVPQALLSLPSSSGSNRTASSTAIFASTAGTDIPTGTEIPSEEDRLDLLWASTSDDEEWIARLLLVA